MVNTPITSGRRAGHRNTAPVGSGAQMTPSACSTWASLGGASGGVIGPRAEGHPTLGGDGMDCPGTMTGPLRFRTVQVMDGKLAEMAKGTVFARCTRRELIVLGRLFEVARLAPGAALPAGDGRWLHVVLEGRALSIVEGRPDGMLGEGAIWPGSGQGRPQHDLRTGECVVALTEVTLASVATRCLGAVARCSPEVGARLTRTDGLVVAVAPEATTSAVDECDNDVRRGRLPWLNAR